MEKDDKVDLIVRYFIGKPFNLYPHELKEELKPTDILKLFFRSINKYEIFYMLNNKQLIAYCFLKHNYLSKYVFLKNNDLLINPYFVKEEYREKGYGKQIISVSLKNTNNKDCSVYAIVKDNNISSIEVLESLNFSLLGYSKRTLWKHKLVKEKTSLLIYKYDLSN